MKNVFNSLKNYTSIFMVQEVYSAHMFAHFYTTLHKITGFYLKKYADDSW